MTEQPDGADAPPALPALKVVEPEIDPEKPWIHDVLDRKEIAERLTSIVHGQDAPFVISVDGRWGTGKTFLLKRWVHDLRNQGFEAIYYNAWEDDFSDDPLLAIIGQLSEHFGDGRFQKIVRGVANAGLAILTKHLIGTSIKLDDFKGEVLLDEYGKQQETKRKVQAELGRLAAEVRKDTGQPLVFVIDELDRCRPTFAIELLERVKHIFDVPSVVFVFGINRAELVKSLESVYGEIDAGTYLRRFFDMEFVLPDADPEQFCRYLVAKFGLSKFLSDVDQRRPFPAYARELHNIAEFLPVVLGRLDLSLRDMDYCVRLVALAARASLANTRLYAPLLVLLAATKLHDPELYRRFVQGDARGAELIDHLYALGPMPDPAPGATSNLRRALTWLEVAAYCADDRGRALSQLRQLENGEAPGEPRYISSRLIGLDLGSAEPSRRLKEVIGTMEENQHFEGYEHARRTLAENIDIHYGFVRR